jgi:hypothetical protein
MYINIVRAKNDQGQFFTQSSQLGGRMRSGSQSGRITE